MDYAKLEAMLDDGEHLEVTYQYPTTDVDADFATRTDKLLAVEPAKNRFFVSFKGRTPVWIERHEVLNIEPRI